MSVTPLPRPVLAAPAVRRVTVEGTALVAALVAVVVVLTARLDAVAGEGLLERAGRATGAAWRGLAGGDPAHVLGAIVLVLAVHAVVALQWVADEADKPLYDVR